MRASPALLITLGIVTAGCKLVLLGEATNEDRCNKEWIGTAGPGTRCEILINVNAPKKTSPPPPSGPAPAPARQVLASMTARHVLLSAIFAVVLLATGCATLPTNGGSYGITWRVVGLRIEERVATRQFGVHDAGRIKVYRYTVILNDTRGVGVRFHRIEQLMLQGRDVRPVPPSKHDVTWHLQPNGEFKVTFTDTAWLELPGGFQNTPADIPTAVKTFFGTDDSGNPVKLVLRYHPENIPPATGRDDSPPSEVTIDKGDPRHMPYLKGVADKIKSNWRWPCVRDSSARECEYKDALVVVQFGILRSGLLQFVEVKQSSGVPQYDEAGVHAIRSSSPFPEVPAVLMETRPGSAGIPITIRFQYRALFPQVAAAPSLPPLSTSLRSFPSLDADAHGESDDAM